MNSFNKYLVYKNNIISKNGTKKFIPNFDLKSAFEDDTKLDFLIKENFLFKSKAEFINSFVKINDRFNNKRLMIQLTNKCNLKCQHCYLASSIYNNKSADFNNLKNIIDKAISLGIWRIDFTGGEIFTYEHILELFSYLNNKNVSSILFTNLTLLNKEKIEFIKSLSFIREIITSLDYFNMYKHDKFRGKKGAYLSTFNNILELRKSGLNISINTMLLKDNRQDILDMIDFFVPKGIKIHIDTIINSGRAKYNNKDLINDTLDDFKFIKRCIERTQKIENKSNYNYRDLGCGVGESLLFIDYNLNFQICSGLTEDKNRSFYLGKDFDEALDRLKSINLNCSDKECKYSNECTNGCRMRSFEHSESIQSCDKALYNYMKAMEQKND